jgi:hypothetical protein
MFMTSDWKALSAEVISSLSISEKEESIVYIEQRIIPAGEKLAGINLVVDVPVIVAFIDLEPQCNWTHRSRYLLVTPEGGIHTRIEADKPPFLIHVSPYLRVIYIGKDAPQWAVVAPPMQ